MNDITQHGSAPLLLNPTPIQLEAMQAALEQSVAYALAELHASKQQIIEDIQQAIDRHDYDAVFDYYEKYDDAAVQDIEILKLFELAKVQSKNFGYISQMKFIYQTLPRRIYDPRYFLYAELEQWLKKLDHQANWFKIPDPEDCDDFHLGEPYDGMLEISASLPQTRSFCPGIVYHQRTRLFSNTSEKIECPLDWHQIPENAYYIDPETATKQYYAFLAQQEPYDLKNEIQQFITHAPLTDYAIQKFFAFHAMEMPELARFYCLNRSQILEELQGQIRELRHDNVETTLQTYHDIAVNLNDSAFFILEKLAKIGFDIYASRAELSLELNITSAENWDALYYNTQRMLKLYPAHMQFVQGKNGLISIIEKQIKEKHKAHKYFELSLLYQKLYAVRTHPVDLKLAQRYHRISRYIKEWRILAHEPSETIESYSNLSLKRWFAPEYMYQRFSLKHYIYLSLTYGILIPFMGIIFLTLLVTTLQAITQSAPLTPLQTSLALSSIFTIPIAGSMFLLNIPAFRLFLYQRFPSFPSLSLSPLVLANILIYFILIGIRIIFAQ